jgi:hypothetical protein
MNNAGSANQFIDFWLTLTPQFGHIKLCLFDGASRPVGHVTTDIPYRLESCHFVTDSRFSSKQVRLMGTEPLGIEDHSMT